jgi:predicted O-methyltransferase YrrM
MSHLHIPASYHPLLQKLGIDSKVPFTKDWSAAADFVQLIVDEVLVTKPQTIVECSSGLTTLMLARACQIAGQGRVFSLENGPEYAQNCRDYIERYGLESIASVIDAPLVDTVVGGNTFQWYSVDDLSPLKIDMLVIDGPPGFIQKHSRYPALPMLMDRLADNCVVFLDDAGRDEEKELVAMWLQDYPEFEHDNLDYERGCSVLRRGK